MATEERYLEWKPQGVGSGDVTVEAFCDDVEGVRSVLKLLDGRILRIAFDSPVAYRNINETYRQRSWSEWVGTDIAGLYLVESSRWVEWLVGEAGGILSAEKLTHFAIFTVEDCIDVVTEVEPRVDWLVGESLPKGRERES